ncbi:MAG: hypothetical protein HOE48_17350, partial [Candidatus Latescibacteria bacterium]|nr:hypothetical protein [Candidatus Latescibacterota bacterium]
LIAAYFIGDLTVHIPIMLFWTFAVFLFEPRQAKRLFGFIGAGGTLGCIVVGFIVKPISVEFGTPALIILIIALLTCFVMLVVALSRTESHRFPSPNGKKKPLPQLQQYIQHFKTPQIQHLIGVVFVANIVLALIDYQFKAGARMQYAPADLAGFFGDFYAYTSIVALVIQLFLVHQILQRGGIRLGLSLLPFGILIGCIGILITAQYTWILITKIMVQFFLFTIDIAAVQMLFMSIPASSRNQARAFTDGIIKPIAIATTGVALVALVHYLPLYYLAAGGVVLSIIWLILAHTNSKAYIFALIESLDAKKFDHSTETTPFQDHTLVGYIREALRTAPDQDILYLLSITNEISEENWTADYRKLIDNENPEIKIRCIQHLAKHGDPTDIQALDRGLKSSTPSVRAETISAITMLGSAEVTDKIEPFLDDPSPLVQASAIASLVNQGNLDQQSHAGIRFRDLLHSKAVTDRVAATKALADIHDSTLNRSLTSLLQDPSIEVQTAALKTCLVHKDIALLPVLVPLLSDPEVGPLTSQILSSFGPKVVDHLLPLLKLAHESKILPELIEIPGVLSAIGDTRALPVLLTASEYPNALLRNKCIQAYATLLKATPPNQGALAETHAQIKKEMAQAKRRQTEINNNLNTQGTVLLTDALNHICSNHLRNAFLLIDAILPNVDIMVIFETLVHNGTTSNNALEILDNILPKQIRNEVIDFFDALRIDKNNLNHVLEFESFLESESDIWVICGILMATIENQKTINDDGLTPFLNHPNPVVRETALYTLHKQKNTQVLGAQCLRLKDDTNQAVQRLARDYLDELEVTPITNSEN